MLTQGNCFKLSREKGGKKPARREFERLLVLCEGKIDYVHQMFFFNGCFIDEKLK